MSDLKWPGLNQENNYSPPFEYTVGEVHKTSNDRFLPLTQVVEDLGAEPEQVIVGLGVRGELYEWPADMQGVLIDLQQVSCQFQIVPQPEGTEPDLPMEQIPDVNMDPNAAGTEDLSEASEVEEKPEAPEETLPQEPQDPENAETQVEEKEDPENPEDPESNAEQPEQDTEPEA